MGRFACLRAALQCVCTLVFISACGDAVATAPPVEGPIPAPGSLYPLALETFDGSGEAVHPDPVVTPAGWGEAETYLVATPYPGGSSRYENPSYYEGGSPIDWHPPQGVVNPIATPGDGAYLSDPDQVYDPVTNRIWLYYRRVTTENEIWLIRSADGVHWDTPTMVVHVPNHQAVSPAVVRKADGEWMMWVVNSGEEGCSANQTTVELRRSNDGVHWSDPSPVSMPSAAAGESPWHLDVTWVAERREFWALYNAKTKGSCTTEVLRLARSTDGSRWTTYPAPVLSKGAIPEFADVVYRASMVYNAATDRVTLWYSGARQSGASDTTVGYRWHLAMQQMPRETMFGIASGKVAQAFAGTPAATGDRHMMRARDERMRARAPLTNATAP